MLKVGSCERLDHVDLHTSKISVQRRVDSFVNAVRFERIRNQVQANFSILCSGFTGTFFEKILVDYEDACGHDLKYEDYVDCFNAILAVFEEMKILMSGEEGEALFNEIYEQVESEIFAFSAALYGKKAIIPPTDYVDLNTLGLSKCHVIANIQVQMRVLEQKDDLDLADVSDVSFCEYRAEVYNRPELFLIAVRHGLRKEYSLIEDVQEREAALDLLKGPYRNFEVYIAMKRLLSLIQD